MPESGTDVLLGDQGEVAERGRSPRPLPTVGGMADRLFQLWPPVACFVASRMVVLGALYVAPVISPGYARSSFFTDWDASHYLAIARSGYPPLHPKGGGFNALAAFFPLLSVVTRGVNDVTGLSLRTSGIWVANLAALAAFCVVWLLARDVLGRSRATAAVALLAFWPASFTLSMIYPDGLMILLAAGYLLALRRQQWLVAFGLGVLAGLSRPDAVVLFLSGAWAAVEVLRSGRSWRSWRPWLAAAGPAVGFAAFIGYLWAKLGTPSAWFEAERQGWGNSFDFGHTWWSDALVALHHPTARIDLVASTAAGIIGLALVVWMVVLRLPPILTIYAAGVLLLAIGSGFGGGIPRYCLDAFPIFFAPAAKLRPAALTLIIGISAGGMALFLLLVELTRTTTP
jgi:hypothetical protein